MTRHHGPMMNEVVEAVILAVQNLAAVIDKPPTDLTKGTDAMPGQLETFVYRAVMVTVQIVSQLKGASFAAFTEQGGLQMMLQLVQPSSGIDAFCCTVVSDSIGRFLQDCTESTESIIPILMKEAKCELQNLSKTLSNIDHETCITQIDEEECKVIIKQMSKAARLLKVLAPQSTPGSSPQHLVDNVLDGNLCILPELEETLGPVINLLSISDEWRLAWDNKLANGTNSIDDKASEIKRQALHYYFRSCCYYYNAISTIPSAPTYIWSDNSSDNTCIIAMLGSSAVLRCIKFMRQHYGNNVSQIKSVRKSRFLIQLDRLLTALTFDLRRVYSFTHSLHSFLEHGVFGVLLEEVQWTFQILLSKEFTDYVPSANEILDQEKQLESTNGPRKSVGKEVPTSLSSTISINQSCVTLLGFLELATSLSGYDKDRNKEDGIRIGCFRPAPWRSDAQNLCENMIDRISHMTQDCIISLMHYANEISKYPLHVSKIANILGQINMDSSLLLKEVEASKLDLVSDTDLDFKAATVVSSIPGNVELEDALKALKQTGNSVPHAIKYIENKMGMTPQKQLQQADHYMPPFDKKRTYLLSKSSVDRTAVEQYLYSTASPIVSQESKKVSFVVFYCLKH